jgi:bifunctional non-homologous end joining protein LigD
MPSKPSAKDPLKEYERKRDFHKTTEPIGKVAKRAGKPRAAKPHTLRFCVQKHLASHLHYDFRLEHNGVLLSWAVPKGPSLNPKDRRLAMRVEDHPLEYGKFEGVIPEGYGAGIVMLWDKGTWKPQVEDVDAALEKGDLKFTLKGIKLKGSWVLVRTRLVGSKEQWLLIKHRDEWAGAIDVTEAAPLSAKSFGDFADILAAAKPKVRKAFQPTGGGEAGALLKQVVKLADERSKQPR